MGGAKPLLTSVVCALSLYATPKLELRGKVTGASNGVFRISLFGIDKPYEQFSTVFPSQEFSFRPLESGSYSLVVARRGIGAVRRTVVISPSLADKKGVIRFCVPYVPAEAALEVRGTSVSRGELSVPDKAWRRWVDARRDMARHQIERAVENLKKAVEFAPKFSAAWNTLGVISYQGRDYPKAEEFFRQAVAAEPESFEAIVNLGGVLLTTGKWKEALEDNQKAQTARPQDPLANAQLGLSYFQLGDGRRAEQYLLAAKHIDPAHFTRPQLYLARIYLDRGEVKKAVGEVRDFISRYPDAPEARSLKEKLGDR